MWLRSGAADAGAHEFFGAVDRAGRSTSCGWAASLWVSRLGGVFVPAGAGPSSGGRSWRAGLGQLAGTW